jgi:hypothetical protein
MVRAKVRTPFSKVSRFPGDNYQEKGKKTMIRQRNLDESLQKRLGIAENVEGSRLKNCVKEYAADGVIDLDYEIHLLGSGIDLTGVTPRYIGQKIALICMDSTTNATATTGAGVTWDGTNDLATFADAGDAIFAVAVSLTRWFVHTNVGAVAFT